MKSKLATTFGALLVSGCASTALVYDEQCVAWDESKAHIFILFRFNSVSGHRSLPVCQEGKIAANYTLKDYDPKTGLSAEGAQFGHKYIEFLTRDIKAEKEQNSANQAGQTPSEGTLIFYRNWLQSLAQISFQDVENAHQKFEAQRALTEQEKNLCSGNSVIRFCGQNTGKSAAP